MKKTAYIMILAALTASTTMAGIVAYWESDVNAPDWFDAGIVTAASFKTGVANDATWNSTDQTYGTLAGATSAANGAFKGQTGSHMSIKITNMAANDLRLDSVHFDFSWAFGDGSPNVTLETAGGDLDDANGTIIADYTATSAIGKATDYDDIDVNFSSVLTDRVLANGEYVTMRFTFNDATGGGRSGIDNIAVQATVIPEPGTLGLVASLGAAIVFMRRKMKR